MVIDDIKYELITYALGNPTLVLLIYEEKAVLKNIPSEGVGCQKRCKYRCSVKTLWI